MHICPQVLVLEKLTVAHIEKILHRAVTELGAQVTEHGQSLMDDDPRYLLHLSSCGFR